MHKGLKKAGLRTTVGWDRRGSKSPLGCAAEQCVGVHNHGEGV